MAKFGGAAEKCIFFLLIFGQIAGALLGGSIGKRNQWNVLVSSLIGLVAGLVATGLLFAILVLIERFVRRFWSKATPRQSTQPKEKGKQSRRNLS